MERGRSRCWKIIIAGQIGNAGDLLDERTASLVARPAKSGQTREKSHVHQPYSCVSPSSIHPDRHAWARIATVPRLTQRSTEPYSPCTAYGRLVIYNRVFA